MLYKIKIPHSVYSLSYLDGNVNMVRLELPEILLGKHLLHTHRCFDDAEYHLDTERCNETRFKAVGSHKFQLIFSLLIGNINYYYVDSLTLFHLQKHILYDHMSLLYVHIHLEKVSTYISLI